MDINDPRLIESHKNLTERIKKLDDFIVTGSEIPCERRTEHDRARRSLRQEGR